MFPHAIVKSMHLCKQAGYIQTYTQARLLGLLQVLIKATVFATIVSWVHLKGLPSLGGHENLMHLI